MQISLKSNQSCHELIIAVKVYKQPATRTLQRAYWQSHELCCTLLVFWTQKAQKRQNLPNIFGWDAALGFAELNVLLISRLIWSLILIWIFNNPLNITSKNIFFPSEVSFTHLYMQLISFADVKYQLVYFRMLFVAVSHNRTCFDLIMSDSFYLFWVSLIDFTAQRSIVRRGKSNFSSKQHPRFYHEILIQIQIHIPVLSSLTA